VTQLPLLAPPQPPPPPPSPWTALGRWMVGEADDPLSPAVSGSPPVALVAPLQAAGVGGGE